MDAAAELDQIVAKESWTPEDCRRLEELFVHMREPAARLRQHVAAMTAASPAPAGAPAVKLGIARYLLNHFGEAVEALAKGADNKERRFYQALSHKHLRQWDQALENFQLAEDRGWDARQTTLEQAEVLCLTGQAEAAARALDRFAKSSQDSPDWHVAAGLLAETRGSYDAAVASYETARQLSPGHPAATFRLAYFYDLHGDEEAAMELYRQCVARAEQPAGTATPAPRPLYASALLNLAVLYEDAGRYDDAARCLRRILACDPNHFRARLFLKDVVASKTMVFDEEEAKRTARQNDLLAIPVTDFELSVRARNCLKKMNIRTIGDLLHVTELELLGYKNFGETSLSEIKTMLTSKGLRLGQYREDVAELGDFQPDEPRASVGNEGVLATPVAQIEFSVRVRKALERLGVRTLGELASKTEAELLACRNFGQTSLNEVVGRLGEYGLGLREAE